MRRTDKKISKDLTHNVTALDKIKKEMETPFDNIGFHWEGGMILSSCGYNYELDGYEMASAIYALTNSMYSQGIAEGKKREARNTL